MDRGKSASESGVSGAQVQMAQKRKVNSPHKAAAKKSKKDNASSSTSSSITTTSSTPTNTVKQKTDTAPIAIAAVSTSSPPTSAVNKPNTKEQPTPEDDDDDREDGCDFCDTYDGQHYAEYDPEEFPNICGTCEDTIEDATCRSCDQVFLGLDQWKLGEEDSVCKDCWERMVWESLI